MGILRNPFLMLLKVQIIKHPLTRTQFLMSQKCHSLSKGVCLMSMEIKKMLKTQFRKLPIEEGRLEELGKWLKREFHVRGNMWDSSSVDIAASGLGWFAIGLKGEAKLGVWTYDGIDVIVCNALLPNRSHDFVVTGFTVSKIVSTADRTSNKERHKEKKRKLSDSTAEKPAESSIVDVTSTTC